MDDSDAPPVHTKQAQSSVDDVVVVDSDSNGDESTDDDGSVVSAAEPVPLASDTNDDDSSEDNVSVVKSSDDDDSVVVGASPVVLPPHSLDHDLGGDDDSVVSLLEGGPNCLLYVPGFVEEYRLLNLSVEEQKRKLLLQNWLNSSLVKEITSYFPQQCDINRNDGNRRDPEAFRDNVSKMFPVGRLFASSKQLDQAAEMLLSNWGVKKVHNAKSIRCFFSAPTNSGRKKAVPDSAKRRNVSASLKIQYKCPFKIRYSLVGYTHKQDAKMPQIFYQVRITDLHLIHTCDLSTTSHRVAIQKSGNQQPNLIGMNDVMSLLREKPMLSAETLRPLLVKYLPTYYGIDAKFIANFRQRAQHYMLHHGDTELCMTDVHKVSSRKPLASDELLLSDDPLLQQNVTNLLRHILSTDAGTWHAISFLEKIKVASPGFDFRLKRDDNGSPEGVCWITPEMRSDLLRYGSILFLDAQKKQYNSLGWPYIGPCVKDCDMKVRVVTECLIVGETHEAYIWVMEQIVDMEPRFELGGIKLIFADQFLSEKLLLHLNIAETCTLRGDYYHLLNEVLEHSFGKHMFSQMKEYLKLMLLGSKADWEHGYSKSLLLLAKDAEKMMLLQQIYSNPKYYAGWYLRLMEENLFLNGSVPAEQNHSSITAHLGKGASWGIAEHIKHLIVRQRDLTTQRRSREASRCLSTNKYKSDFREQKQRDDELAIRSLSKWAYENLFVVEYRKISKLDQEELEDGSFQVWRRSNDKQSDSFITIKQDKRCPCERRVGYNHQCAHELLLDGQLRLEKYSARWLNISTFNSQTASHQATQKSVQNDGGSNNDNGDSDTSRQVSNQNESDESDGGNSNDDDNEATLSQLGANTKGATVDYKSVSDKAGLLVRFAASNDTKLIQLAKLFDVVWHRLRNGQSIEAHFDLSLPVDARGQGTSDNPVRGTMQTAPNATNQKRKKSRLEHNRSKHAKKQRAGASGTVPSTSSALPPSNDLEYAVRAGGVEESNVSVDLTAPGRRATVRLLNNDDNHATGKTKRKGKSCGVCREPGHKRDSCEKILRFKTKPLEFGKTARRFTRNKLCGDLHRVGRFKVEKRMTDDLRSISISIPSGTKGIVIHRRLCEVNDISATCLECTLLYKDADMNPLFTNYLFSTDCVTTYIGGTKENIVINELEDAVFDHGMESVGFPTMQQLSQQLTQQQTMSQQSNHLTQQHGINQLSQHAMSQYMHQQALHNQQRFHNQQTFSQHAISSQQQPIHRWMPSSLSESLIGNGLSQQVQDGDGDYTDFSGPI